MEKEISAFLALFEMDAAQDDIDALVRALDDLVIAYNRSADTFDDHQIDAPSAPDFHAAAVRNFPSLGLYPVMNPQDTLDDKPSLADAHDDIADIARDLSEVLWRLEHVSFEDANWHFRFLYGAHWGAHLHSLRVYLHAKQYR